MNWLRLGSRIKVKGGNSAEQKRKAIPYTLEVWGDFLSALRFSAKGDCP
ncbi:hypothetical protein [Desulfosporosinus sp. BG]|nr:hypothetical protein [Desulfosporosinus sp. BG]ODA39935.1 hypothetical protein DSBG_3309 [Desulfosporosinus sp. BG]